MRLRVIHFGGRVVEIHDAGVVDEGVELGMVGDQLLANGGDAIGICDVEFDGLHSGIGFGDFGEVTFTAAGDDDLIAELVEGFVGVVAAYDDSSVAA